MGGEGQGCITKYNGEAYPRGGGQGRIQPIENMGDIQVSKRLGGVLGEDAPKGTI